MTRIIETRFALLAAVPIFLMAALQISSSLQESATYDEAVHLAAGYRYWRTGRFTMNLEHPPLQKLLSALPLLPVAPPMPADEKLLDDQTAYANEFLYRGPYPAGRLLLLGRLPTMLFSALLLAALAWSARRYFGAPAALAAVWLCALDPNLIAHGRYVTNDVASALLFFLACVLWGGWLRAPSPGRAAAAAIALGLALAAKFSMILLLALLPALAAVHALVLRTGPRRALRSLGVLAMVGAGATLVVALSYAPESWRVLRGRPIGAGPETIAGITLPPHTFFTGLRTVLEHNSEGHPAYLLGRTSATGWWYYFPVVFAVKSPSALLLLLLLSAAIGLCRLPRLFRDPSGAFPWLLFLIPPLAYFGVTLTSHINLGVRHLLPVYPFLYVLGAGAILRSLPARLAGIAALSACLLQAAESAAAYPNYLAFFNAPAGGASAGPRYLLDSNIDWGQDLIRLKRHIEKEIPGPVCLNYFGSADPGYYGIHYEFLPRTWDRDERERVNCIGAISVTLLHDVYLDPGSYEWLRRRKPIGVVGSSIYLYDLRKPPRP